MQPRLKIWLTTLPVGIPVFLAAFGVRLVFGWLVGDLKFAGAAGLDSRFYHEWAAALATGSSIEGASFMGPLYPYSLALVYRLFGANVEAALVFQILLGSGTTCLSFLIGRHLFGPKSGILAAVLLTFYGYLLFLERHILAAPLLLFLLTLATWLVVRAEIKTQRGLYLVVGVVAGLLALGRGSFLIAAVFAVVVWLVRSKGRMRRKVMVAAGLGALGTALVVVPVSWHNSTRSDEIVLISANGGINYYIGNNPGADGTFVNVPGVEFFQPGMPVDGGSVALAERQTGRPLDASGASRVWLLEGLSWNMENLGRTVALWGRKFIMALGAYEIPQIENYGWAQRSSPILRIGAVRFGWLVALGIVGMALAWRDAPRSRMLVLLAAAFLVSLLPFFITARYRIPMAPVLAVFAAHTLLTLWRYLRAGEIGRWLVPAGAVVLVLVLVNAYRPPGIQAGSDRLHEYSLGVMAVREQRLDAALQHFERSRQEYPDHVPTLANLGTLYAYLGHYAEAIPVFERVLRLDPRNDRVLENYAVCLEETGRGRDAARVRDQLRTNQRPQGQQANPPSR